MRESADGSDPQYADGSPGQYVILSRWPQPGSCGFANCPGTPLTLTYSFQNMFDGALKMPDGNPLPATYIRAAIEKALRLWSEAAPLNFVEVPDDGLPYGLTTHYGQIRFWHGYINGPDPVIGDPVAKAQTYFPPGDGLPGDVEFDDSDRWQENGTLRQPDVLGAAIHEIGHALGLGHSTGIIPDAYWSYQRYENGQIVDHLEPMGNANMFWIFMRTTGLDDGKLYPDDVAGIQAIYGAGAGSLTSLVAPEPSALSFLFLAAGSWLLRRRRR